MGIRVLEIHHHAVRIDSEAPKLEAVQPIPAGRRFPVCPVSGSMSARVDKFT